MKKSAQAGSAKQKKTSASHKLAERFPEGLVLADLTKKEWKLGQPVGSGGFGLIYLAEPNSSSPVRDNSKYVVKVEPHTNGPLFCELHFYQRAAKPETIREWTSSHKLKSLGVPQFIATGNTEYKGTRYRFLVMERFGADLQKLFEEKGKRFPTQTVLLLGIKLLDVLEYIHSKEYVHADIKASNLLTGYTDHQQIYLVDYGLAFRYIIDGKHKEYKEDPKRAHDGTIEFTSRDAHRGVAPSRRGDLEILGYCIVQWLCGQLPWEDKLSDKNYVSNEKRRYMSDISLFMKKCFPDATSVPVKELSAYLLYVANLEYAEQPNYNQCRQIFTRALSSIGCKETAALDFDLGVSSPKGRKRAATSSPCAKKSAKPLLADDSVSSSPKVRKVSAAAAVKQATPSTAGKKSSSVDSVKKRAQDDCKPRSSKAQPATTSKDVVTVNKVKRVRRRAVNVTSTGTQTTPGLSRTKAAVTSSSCNGSK